MSDTWEEIQNFKSRHSGLKERLQRRKKERQEVVDEIIGPAAGLSPNASTSCWYFPNHICIY